MRIRLAHFTHLRDNKSMKKDSLPSQENLDQDIFDFHDYREFLSQYIEKAKSEKKKFSLRSLAKDLGVTHSLLSLILSNRRNLSDELLLKIIFYFQFDEQQEDYFRCLVDLSDARKAEERNRAFEKIKKFKRFQKQRPKEFETYRYLSSWYYVAIRELAQRKDFQFDPKWIRKKLSLPVPLREIKKAIKFLLDHGFIAKDDKGKAYLPDKVVSCKRGAFQLSLNHFHKEMLNITIDSIDQIKKENRRLFGYTLAIPQGKLAELSKILENAEKQIAALEETEENLESVYHVSFAAVQLAGDK